MKHLVGFIKALILRDWSGICNNPKRLPRSGLLFVAACNSSPKWLTFGSTNLYDAVDCFVKSNHVVYLGRLAFLKFSLTLWQVLCIMSQPSEPGCGIVTAFQHFGLTIQAVFSKMQTFSQTCYLPNTLVTESVIWHRRGPPAWICFPDWRWSLMSWLEVECRILDYLVVLSYLSEHTVIYNQCDQGTIGRLQSVQQVWTSSGGVGHLIDPFNGGKAANAGGIEVASHQQCFHLSYIIQPNPVESRRRPTTWLQPRVCSPLLSEFSSSASLSMGMGWIFNVVPANILASWSTLLASIKALIFARLIWDCNIPKRLPRSGLLFVAACNSSPKWLTFGSSDNSASYCSSISRRWDGWDILYILFLFDPNTIIILLFNFKANESEVSGRLLKGTLPRVVSFFHGKGGIHNKGHRQHGSLSTFSGSIFLILTDKHKDQRGLPGSLVLLNLLQVHIPKIDASTLPYAPLSNFRISFGANLSFSLSSIWGFQA